MEQDRSNSQQQATQAERHLLETHFISLNITILMELISIGNIQVTKEGIHEHFINDRLSKNLYENCHQLNSPWNPDKEHPSKPGTPEDVENYVEFIKKLKEIYAPAGKEVTAAMGAPPGRLGTDFKTTCVTYDSFML